MKNRLPRKLKKKIKKNRPVNYMSLLIPDEYDVYFSEKYQEPPYPVTVKE